jgi:PAS domain S-box-containing protein
LSEESAREHRRIEHEIHLAAASSDPFASAVRATRMPMLITDPTRPDNPIVFSNDAFTKLTGYTREEIVGKNCRFLQGAETDPKAVTKIRDAIERRVPIEIDLLNHKKSGETFWNRLLISPVFDPDGQLIYYFASQFDVTLEKERLVRLQEDRDALEREVERRTGDLVRSEDRLRFILKAGRFGLWTLDLADRRLMASDMCKENFGRDRADPFGYDDLLAAVDPEDRERMQAAVRTAIESRTDYDIEYRIRTPDGQRRWIEVRGQTSYAADGTPLSMAGVSIDVTERKRGEEHRALLAAELDHRVKNSMANIQAIASQTLRNAASLEDARLTLEARLASLARAHDVLTGGGWSAVSMSEVVDGALAPFRTGAGKRFSVGGPDVRLTPRLALAFVLALHELATNAVKYGALSAEKGRVILNWDIHDGDADSLWMRWEEIGGPPVAEPTRKGFGSRMIERALATELGGTAEIEYRAKGVVFTVQAPLPDVEPGHADAA